jgi:hypothetical protein
MRAINGKLDMSKQYRLVDIEYHGKLDIGSAESCENCGQIISNVAIVRDNAEHVFRIGLDCMQTIVNMPVSDIQQAKNIVNRKRNFIKQLGYAERVEVHNNTFWFYTRTEYNTLMIRGRGDWSLYQNYIKSLNIPIEIRN